MANWICETCGKSFKRDRSGMRVVRFCSQKCYHDWRRENGIDAGLFPKGRVPWNKGTKGRIKPNSGTFKVGNELGVLAVGTTTLRCDKAGRQRTWIKVADNRDDYDWRPLATVVWETANGPLPAEYVIHHRDRDTLNDALDNLTALTRAEHLREHRHAISAARKRSAGTFEAIL